MLNRRNFIKQTTAASVALPCFNIARAGVSANEKLNHASFGGGGMALSDLKKLGSNTFVNLTAVAEVDESRWAKVQELFPQVKMYKDWRELLEKEGDRLDSVNVSTPDHMHAPIGVTAMNMGLHVYGQKPLAQTLYETRRMTEVAKETGVVTQMGIQLSSSFYERMTVQMIQEGLVGKIKEVYVFSHKTWGDSAPKPDRIDPVPAHFDWDLWLGIAAERPFIDKYYHPGKWRCRLDFGTGTFGDMGCHLYSPMCAALKLRDAISVTSTGGQPNEHSWALDERVEYIFPGNEFTAEETIKATWCDGALRPPKDFVAMFGDKMPRQGSIFVGTEGILLHPHGGLPRPYPRENYPDFRPPRPEARNHYDDFVAAIRGEKVKPIADFITHGGPLTESILLGTLATRFPNQPLEWDAKNLRVKNVEEANQFVRRSYRKGWEVKGLS